MKQTNHNQSTRQEPSRNILESVFDVSTIEGEQDESRQWLAAILATVQVGILIIDAESHLIVDANPKALELIGCTRDALVGALCHKFICPADRGQCPITDLGQCIDNTERSLLTAAGECLPIIKTVAQIKMRERTLLVESFLDISDRKLTEEALRDSEERYRDILDNASDLVQSVDPNGSFLFVNRAWKETMGYTDEEIAGLNVFDILSPECKIHCVDSFRRIMAGEALQHLEAQFVAKDGRKVILEGNVNCHFVEGKPVATRSIFRDITERKQVEKEREDWSRKLEIQVAEKTRHLKEAQAKLIQTEKMTTLGEVIAGASHELNNPLAGILGAIQLLRSSALVQPIVPELMDGIDVLESIESAAIRCQRIVEDLIRFSTQASCNFSSMDINELLRDTLDVLSEQNIHAGIKVKWLTDAALPAIEGDFVKLFEVFVNILQNAKSALSEGGSIKITTQLTKIYGETPKVIISIRDTGCGIPAKNLGKIFDPFFTTKPVGKGTGLGLTVSYGIIKRHNGDIDVRSSIGKGTEVTITLPVRQPQK